jgi:hypothetical protein
MARPIIYLFITHRQARQDALAKGRDVVFPFSLSEAGAK